MNQNRDNSCNIRHFCVTDSAFSGKTNLSMTMLRSQKLRIACMEYDTRGITRSGVHMVGEFQLVTPRLSTFTWWIIWPQQEKTNNAPERGCDMASKTKPGSSVYNTKFICNELVLHEGFKPCCAKLLHFQVLYWPFSVWTWSYEDLCSHFFNLDRIKKRDRNREPAPNCSIT